MQTIGKLLGVALLVGLSLQMFGGSYGESYDHYKKNSINLTEEDMHRLHDAFHINLHFTEEQADDLISQIKGKVSSAQTQSTQIGSMIANTQSLIQFVKETKDAITNPTSLLKNSISSIFGRSLAEIGSNAQQVISNLESKIAEAKANQSTVDKLLESSTRFLQSLDLVKNLFNNKASIWDKIKGFFGFSAAHLEKLAAQPENFRGKRRLSLYQQQARSERLYSTADKIKRALHYLNTTPENKLNVHDLEKHLYDLIEDEGTLGRVYLRYVETLKCILLKQCEISKTAAVVADQGVSGENPTLGKIIDNQEANSENTTEGIQSEEEQNASVNGEAPEENNQSEAEPEQSVAVAALNEAAIEESEGGEESQKTEEVSVVSAPEETTSEPIASEETPVSENEPAVAEAQTEEQAESEAGTQPSQAEIEKQLDQVAQEESEIIEVANQEQPNAVVAESTPAEEQDAPVEETIETTDKQIEAAVKEEEEAAQAAAQEETPAQTSAQEETVAQNQSGVYEPVVNAQGEQQITQEEGLSEENPVVYLGGQQVIDVNTGEVTYVDHAPTTGVDNIFVQNESKDIVYPALTNIIAVPVAEGTQEPSASNL